VSTPKDHRGTINPVIHVAENTYQIYTTTKSVYKWRLRLCAPIKSNNPAPVLAPSWDPKTKKTRLVLMLPQLARMVLAEFKEMDRLLRAAVDVMPMEAAIAPSPFQGRGQEAEGRTDGASRRDTSRACRDT